MDADDVWDVEAAQRYDTPGTGMFAPDVLGPTVERLADLAAGGPALELAIGTGRVAIPLVERGVAVRGIERSQPMIDRLREKIDEQRLPVVRGDMATTRIPGAFALVYVVFNSLSCLLTQSDQVACVRNAARHLSPGGWFVVELFVPDLRALPPGKTAAAFLDEPGHLGVDTWDVVAQRLVSHHVRFDPERGGGVRAHLFRSPHRYVWPAELDLMAQLAGLELEGRDGDWTGAPFTAGSISHVSAYRRPTAEGRAGPAPSAQQRGRRRRHHGVVPSPLVAALDLEPHPEGGWFRQTWRAPEDVETVDGRLRSTATLIHFLLHAGESSAWHRVASDEIWLAHVGTVTLELGGDGDAPEPSGREVVGTDIASGQSAQVVVPAGRWQRTIPGDADALVSCVVSPGFDFADFELHDRTDLDG